MPELEKIFLQIVQLSLEAGFLVLAVVLLRLVFRNAPKWLHCLMWAVVAVKLICPFGIESEASPMPRSDAVRSTVESTASTSEAAEELPEQQPTIQLENPEQPSESHGTSMQSHAAQMSAADHSGSRDTLQSGVKVCAWIWLAGMSVILLYAAASAIALRRRLADAVPLGNSMENTDGIYRSDRIQSAFLFGIVRPKIYLPFGVEGENMRQVIAHEKAHIRRLDNVTKALAFVLAAVYWFHPAIWLAHILYCRDIELACDESVVKGKLPDERRAYSMALLACSADKNAFLVNSAIPVQFGQSAVRRRVANVLKNKKPAIGLICVGIVAIVAALAVVMTRPVNYSTDIPKELDEAVARSIFTMNGVSLSDITVDGQTMRYGAVRNSETMIESECLGEGHLILGYRDKGDSVEVYTLCSAIGYGFRDGMLVDESGYFHVATLIKFDKTEDGKYIFKEAQESKDGGLMVPSIKEMFPSALAKKAIAAKADDATSDSMHTQCNAYAAAYLKAIGREAKISSYHDEDFNILSDYGVSVDVCNGLYELHPEYSIYVGSFERIENGVRYIYKQEFRNQKDGSGMVYFTKTEYDSGEVIEIYTYQVNGDSFAWIVID